MSLLAEKTTWMGEGRADQRVDLDVIKIGDDGWRVSLHDADESNPLALLGFVSRTEGRFQVCPIGKPCTELDVATLSDAVEALRPSREEAELILNGTRP